MIFIGSRYQPFPVQYMRDGRTGRTRPTVIRGNEDVTATWSRTTRWEDGLRFDILGSSVYDKPEEWWLVMDQHPDILDPMSFEPGDVLRVP